MTANPINICGITHVVARKNIIGVLLEGLRKIEYRCYDSAGVAVLNCNGTVRTCWDLHGVPCEWKARFEQLSAISMPRLLGSTQPPWGRLFVLADANTRFKSEDALHALRCKIMLVCSPIVHAVCGCCRISRHWPRAQMWINLETSQSR